MKIRGTKIKIKRRQENSADAKKNSSSIDHSIEVMPSKNRFSHLVTLHDATCSPNRGVAAGHAMYYFGWAAVEAAAE